MFTSIAYSLYALPFFFGCGVFGLGCASHPHAPPAPSVVIQTAAAASTSPAVSVTIDINRHTTHQTISAAYGVASTVDLNDANGKATSHASTTALTKAQALAMQQQARAQIAQMQKSMDALFTQEQQLFAQFP